MSFSAMSSIPQYSDNDFSFEYYTQVINQNFGPVSGDEEAADCQIIFDRIGENIERQQDEQQQLATLEGPSSLYEVDDGYCDYLCNNLLQQAPSPVDDIGMNDDYLYNHSTQQATSPECQTCESVVFTSHYLTQLNRIAAQCSYDETTDHNRGACESGVDTYDNLAQQAAQCSWDETLDHYRHYYTSPMVNRPCLFVSADDILEEREDSPLLTNAYQYELSHYNAHHGHAQISYRGRIYIPIGVERDYLQERNQMYMQQQQIDNSSQDLFTQSSEENEQENWMAEFIQDRPEDIEQNHLQYIQQQIEDDSSQNGMENWMEEFIQDRPFYV
uniref:Uncharacterized protein n=1 Tax=Trichogramma kaykai TaxID=54128 RepID=A0ABD2XPA1_9HYME